MGMYTSLRGAVIVKPEFINIIASLLRESTSESDYNIIISHYPFLLRWEKVERGSISMLGSELFQFPLTEDEELFQHRLVGNIWYFTSCIKDYEDEEMGMSPFDIFLGEVLVNITDEILILETASEAEQEFGFRQWYLDKQVNSIVSNFIYFEEWDHSSFEPIRIRTNKDIFEDFKKHHGLTVF